MYFAKLQNATVSLNTKLIYALTLQTNPTFPERSMYP